MFSRQSLKYSGLFLLYFVYPVVVLAQGNEPRQSMQIIKISEFVQNDSIAAFAKDSISFEKDYWQEWDSIPFIYVDTLTIDPIFLPVIFDGKLLPDEFSFIPEYQLFKQTDFIQAPQVNLFEKQLSTLELNRKAYLNLIRQAPGSIKYTKQMLPTEVPVAEKIKVNPFRHIFKVENDVDFSSSERPQKTLPQRRYWTARYETSLQFSQNHVSENWHKGGNSNFNMLFINRFNYEYQKNKTKISATSEYKLSIYTAPTDTLRSYRIGEDVFSLVGSYGYRAFSKWYYSLSLDMRTQFFSNHYENSTTKSSSFLSPGSMNLGLGMEYKLNKSFKKRHKSLDISTNIAPFSYNLKYMLEDEVDKNRHGFTENEDFIKNIGSKISASLQFNIQRNISWNSRFYYFSNYEMVEMEFENTLNLAISRHFTTRINLNIRFDDSVKKKEDSDSYFQFYEILSFGFKYVF